MNKIRVRYAKNDVVFLQQDNGDGAEIRVSMTRRELESLVDFFCNPEHGRHGFYNSHMSPLVVSYNEEDYSYTIERDDVCLRTVRFPPGVEPPAPEPEPEPPKRTLFGIFPVVSPRG